MNSITIENLIISNQYYLTNIDIWLLSKVFNIPIIMYSSTKLVENKKDIMVMNKCTKDKKFFYIKAPGVKKNESNKYRLLVLKLNYKISLNKFSKVMQNQITKQIKNKEENLSEYIKNFELKIKVNKKKLKLKN